MAHVTFALPGDFRSGGVRVTVIMANLLRARGHAIRIACRRPLSRGIRGMKDRLRALLIRTNKNAGWLHEFDGRVAYFDTLDDLDYAPGEIVIAVGTYMVADVRAMTKPVTKVRFNHGFPAKPNAEHDAAWKGTMPTITVSHTLVPRLRELTNGSVWGVVPNGIDTKVYHIEKGIVRDGIGALFNNHPNKAPQDLIQVLREANTRWPAVQQRMFGADARPPELAHVDFTRLPPVATARRIYNSSKVWVLTSRTEGLPGVVLEAMACGCVVVSSDNAGSLEIIEHEKNGLIAPVGDIPAFLAQIERVLTDEPLRARLSAAALQTVERFSWNSAADRMEAFLADMATLTAPGL